MSMIVRVTDKQAVTVTDFRNIAEDPRHAMDAVVSTAIEEGQKYAGGSVAKTATTKVTVGTPLRLYNAGAVFERSDAGGITIDFLSLLPTAGNQRIVAITASGQTQDAQTEERDFEVDGTTFPPVVEAQATATRQMRTVNVATVAGASTPDPVRPAVDNALIVIAYVTLSSTEVASVEQVESNRIKSLGAVNSRLESVETWRAETSPVVDGLRADVAKLGGEVASPTDRRLISFLLESVARLTEVTDVGATATYSRSDFFLDDGDSDTGHSDYRAKIEEGVRFDDEARDTAALALENTSNTEVIVHPSGLLLPKYAEIPAVSVWGQDAEVAISNAGSQTVTVTKRTVSRSMIRYGRGKKVSTSSQWWKRGTYNAAEGVFYRAGETWVVEAKSRERATEKHRYVRLFRFWTDTYDETYWDQLVTTDSYVGTVAGQTFLAPRAGWVTALNLGFSRIDSAGDVRVMLARTTPSGAPDPTNVLAEVTVAHADLKTFPERTAVPIGPVQIDAGQRYAIIIMTVGNHWLALTEGNKFGQGSYFTSADGAWFQGDISRDIAFEVMVAEFEAPRLTVTLADWGLSGGMTDLEVSLEAIGHGLTLDSSGASLSSITFEVKGATGGWIPLTAETVDSDPFAGLPASLDARMVMQGTTEFMPGIWLATSQVTKTRPRTALAHISSAQTPPSAPASVEVIALIEGYTEADHDLTASLLSGAGFATETAPSATSEVVLADGSIKRTFTFTGLSGISSFKRKLSGSASSALDVFHVASATDVAYPS